MGEIDGLAQPMGKLDGRAQPMGKLDGLASKKPGAQAQATQSVACCEAASAAEPSMEASGGSGIFLIPTVGSK